MRAAYSDLARPPLDVSALRRALLAPAGPLARLDVVAETGSTNSDLAAQVQDDPGIPDRTVLVTEHQQAGRGRLARTWSTPARSALTYSTLLRPPAVTEAHWGWLALLAGVSVVRVLRTIAGVDAGLKWPNDVLVPLAAAPGRPVGSAEHKVAGILGEIVRPAGGDPCAVLGIGLNVSITAEEFAAGGLASAASLVLAGSATTDRSVLLRALVRELATQDARWRAAGGDPVASGLAAAARELCLTIGRQVRVSRVAGAGPDADVVGEAVGIDDDGRLLVQTPREVVAVAAGDVHHVRGEVTA